MQAEAFEHVARRVIWIACRVERSKLSLDTRFERAQGQRADPMRKRRAPLLGYLTGRFQVTIVLDDRRPERIDSFAGYRLALRPGPEPSR